MTFFKKQSKEKKVWQKSDKDCSTVLPFEKVLWKYSIPLGSRRRKSKIQWQEMAGSSRHFRGASKYSLIWEHGLHDVEEMSL